MDIIALASQKGGGGKTTLAGHLAVEAEKTGAGPVALLDSDPQGSLAAWWNTRAADTPVFARITIGADTAALSKQLDQLGEAGIALAIIDTPPAITENIRTVVQASDLIIVPTRPSPHDLRAVGATVDLVASAAKPLVFVVNGAAARSTIIGEAVSALAQHGLVAPVTVHQRVTFATAMIDGRTAGELAPGSPAAHEITELWIYIMTLLRK